jgi:hypothetical protein
MPVSQQKPKEKKRTAMSSVCFRYCRVTHYTFTDSSGNSAGDEQSSDYSVYISTLLILQYDE